MHSLYTLSIKDSSPERHALCLRAQLKNTASVLEQEKSAYIAPLGRSANQQREALLPGTAGARHRPWTRLLEPASRSTMLFRESSSSKICDVVVHRLTSLQTYDIIIAMRTTLSLDDDVFRLAKQYAAHRSLALGKAVSELLRRAFRTPRPTRSVNGVQVFDLPPESPRVTTKKIIGLDADQK